MTPDGALFDIKVHPAAEVFPMLGDDELRDLAEDIKANGLIHPIVLDSDGVLIDGRNRLAACNLAGVEPEFESLNGHDPVAFILSSNINRRHMSKGQQAMAAVRVWDVTRNLSLRQFAEAAGQNRERVRQAATVFEYTPDQVERVLLGGLPLDTAYTEARTRKDAASSAEAQIGRLRAEAPDLADLVVEERLSLRVALEENESRKAKARKEREAATQQLVTAIRFLAPRSGDIAAHAEKFLDRFDPSLVPASDTITVDRLNRGIEFLMVVRQALADEGESDGSAEA